MPNRAPVHRPVGAQSLQQRRAVYDAKRGSPSRIYGHEWRRLRAAYLAHHPLCECGCGYAATVVHHVKPHNGDRALLLAWDNLQALTKPCHDAITASKAGRAGLPVRAGSVPLPALRLPDVSTLTLDHNGARSMSETTQNPTPNNPPNLPPGGVPQRDPPRRPIEDETEHDEGESRRREQRAA